MNSIKNLYGGLERLKMNESSCKFCNTMKYECIHHFRVYFPNNLIGMGKLAEMRMAASSGVRGKNGCG
jgi:hypothetical protein